MRVLIDEKKGTLRSAVASRCIWIKKEIRSYARFRYYVFASKLKVLRYVVRAKDAGARREMWVVLHAYAHSSTRGPRVSECPNDLVIQSQRDLASWRESSARVRKIKVNPSYNNTPANTHSRLAQFRSFFSSSIPARRLPFSLRVPIKPIKSP